MHVIETISSQLELGYVFDPGHFSIHDSGLSE